MHTAASALSSTAVLLAWSLEKLKMTSLQLLASLNDSQITLLLLVIWFSLFSTSYFPNYRALTLWIDSWRVTNGLLLSKEVGMWKRCMQMSQQNLLKVIQMYSFRLFVFVAFDMKKTRLCWNTGHNMYTWACHLHLGGKMRKLRESGHLFHRVCVYICTEAFCG